MIAVTVTVSAFQLCLQPNQHERGRGNQVRHFFQDTCNGLGIPDKGNVVVGHYRKGADKAEDIDDHVGDKVQHAV